MTGVQTCALPISQGAGPAGVSAALWARSRDLDAVVLEAAREPGGQLHHVHFEPRDLPGLEGSAGPALAACRRATILREWYGSTRGSFSPVRKQRSCA